MIQDSCISIDFIITEIAVKWGEVKDILNATLARNEDEIKHFYMIHLFDNPQQVQIVNFAQLLHIILSLSSPMVMSISSSISLPPFSWWTPGISVTAAYNCEFNCFVSFHIKFWSNYIIANFTCTLKRYRKESSTYWVSLWANVTSVCL